MEEYYNSSECVYAPCKGSCRPFNATLTPYLDDYEELDRFLRLANSIAMKRFINEHLSTLLPETVSKDYKLILSDLIYSVTKFCKRSNFTIQQISLILSIFYTTHLFYTSAQDIPPEDVYTFFKELAFRYWMAFPSNPEQFCLKETKELLIFFCKIYLKNLSLIHYLCLPTETVYVTHKIVAEKKEKGGKGKKKKKK